MVHLQEHIILCGKHKDKNYMTPEQLQQFEKMQTENETVTGVVVTTKITLNLINSWMPKGSNYYLGNNQ